MMDINEIDRKIIELGFRIKTKKDELSELQVTLNGLFLDRLRLEIENDMAKRLREAVSGWDKDGD